MGFSDKYRNRLNINGTSRGNAYENNTHHFIESMFDDSPTFRVLNVSSTEKPHITEIDARVIKVERMGSLREVLFRPSSEDLSIGTYVQFDNQTWIIFDKFGKDKALVQMCNQKLRWEDELGELIDLPCITSSMDLGSKAKQNKNEIEWNKYDVRLPISQVFIFVERREETKQIQLNHRFIFNSRVYEIVGIDDTTMVDVNGHGIIQFNAKVTLTNDKDDFENNIAFNSYHTDYSPTPNQGAGNEGGTIW